MFPEEFQPIPEAEATRPDGTQVLPNEAKVLVAFGMWSMPDAEATAKAGGVPQYKDVEHVAIQVPGDKTSFYFQPSKPEDRRRFPQAYKMFKDNATAATVGTPIEKWPLVSRSEVLNLKNLHIRTVEILAEVSDSHIEVFGQRGRELRSLAQAHIKQVKDTEHVNKTTAENQALRDQIAALEQQYRALAEAVEAKRGPGRPKAAA